MNIIDAIREKTLGGKLKEHHETVSSTSTVSVPIDVESGEVFELLGVELEKSDDHDDTTYFGYQISIDGETFGDKSVATYHSKEIDGYHHFFQNELKVSIDCSGMGSGEVVGVIVRYKTYSKSLLQEMLSSLGMGDLLRG